jgi:signal transduction histidine kinase
MTAAVIAAVVPPSQDVTTAAVASFGIQLIPLTLLAWRSRLCEWLLAVALVCWVAAVALTGDGADFTAMVALYTIGAQRTWRRTGAAMVITLGVAGLLYDWGLSHSPVEMLAGLAAQGAGYAAVGAVGLYMGTRGAYVRTLLERTQDLERERELLERERDLMAQRAVAVERVRMARELHDVVAHHVSVMVLQAGAAQASLPPGADAAAGAIEAIRETGHEAMIEMRRLLGLLRSEESSLPDTTPAAIVDAGAGAERSPQPGVADLEALTARTSEAGVAVTMQLVGSPSRIPPAVELSAYRVAQEALTNTLRHAGPGAAASLRLIFGRGTLAVEVIDDGNGRPAIESVERPRNEVGHGLLGMRERVALFGGRLEAGPVPGGGYRVLARFPLDEGSTIDGDPTGPTSASPGQSSEVVR